MRTRCRRGRWAEHSTSYTEHSVEHPVFTGERSNGPYEQLVEHSTEHPEFKSEHSTDDNEHRANFPELPCLPNLIAHTVTLLHPWEVPIVAHCKLADKTAYRAYAKIPHSQDCFISGVLGLEPSEHITRYNPAVRMLAVVADYDTILTPEKRDKMLAKLSPRPNFISTSYSGGTHAVRFLETPLSLPDDEEMRKNLLGVIRKSLKLDSAFGPLDVGAIERLSLVYHAGWDWRMENEEPIAAEMSLLWLVDAAKKPNSNGIEIPLSAVAAEVERRFPGRWQGEFKQEARGVRFRDANSDNPTLAFEQAVASSNAVVQIRIALSFFIIMCSCFSFGCPHGHFFRHSPCT